MTCTCEQKEDVKMIMSWLLVVIIVSLLSSCVGGTTQDLYSSAQSNNATAAAAIQLAQYQEQALTATAEAPIISITSTAAAMAVEQQYWTVTAQSIQQTQMSSFTQTALSWTPTPNATSTAIALQSHVEGTQRANQLEMDRLAVERQRDMNDFQGKLPVYSFVIIVLVLAIVLTFASRRERYRPATVDERGRILPMFDVVEGTVTDVDRMPNYRGDLRENWIKQWWMRYLDLKPQLPAISPERQDATTQRAQLTDLAVRGLPGGNMTTQKRAVAQEMEKQLSAENLQGRFKVLGPGAAPGELIDDEIMTVLDAEWKEAQES